MPGMRLKRDELLASTLALQGLRKLMAEAADSAIMQNPLMLANAIFF